jgi:hypothetical protein
MPTILYIHGWRLFFYSNEGSEPIHIHAEKADMECKFWILVDEVEIQEAFSFNLTPAAKKEIKKIIFQHFDLIAEAWNTITSKNKNVMITTHKIEDLTFDVNVMLLKVDGHIYRISLEKASSKINLANEIERGLFKISPSGYGIHWPLIDEDLSIDNLLKLSE